MQDILLWGHRARAAPSPDIGALLLPGGCLYQGSGTSPKQQHHCKVSFCPTSWADLTPVSLSIPVKKGVVKQEEVCVIDALLADIRKGFTLRKTKNRHELDAIPKTLPAESPEETQSGKDTDPAVTAAIHAHLPLSLSQAQKQEAFVFAFGAFYFRSLCSQ